MAILPGLGKIGAGGAIGGEGASLMKGAKGALAYADDAAMIAARHRPQISDNEKDPSLKDSALDLLKGGVEPGDSFETVDKAVNGVATVAGVVSGVAFANDILGQGGSRVLGWLGGWERMPFRNAFKKAGEIADLPNKHFFGEESNLGFVKKEHIAAENAHIAETNKTLPHNQQQGPFKPTLGSDLFHGAFVLESGVQAYHTARSFLQKEKTLKMIHADMAADRTARHIGGAGDAAPLTDAGKHNYLEHGLRGIAAIAGLVLNYRGLRKGQLGMAAMFVPMLADMGINAFMGESALIESYTPFKNAQKRGQAVVQEYANFIFTNNKEMNSHGALGKAAAMQVAAHYKAINASAAHILNDMATGAMQKLTKEALAHADAAHPHPAAPHGAHAPTPMQDRLNQKTAPHGPVLGKHTETLQTKALAQRTAPDAQQPVPGLS